MAIYSGFTYWKWWFSIVMLVYQRVMGTSSKKMVDVPPLWMEKLLHHLGWFTKIMGETAWFSSINRYSNPPINCIIIKMLIFTYLCIFLQSICRIPPPSTVCERLPEAKSSKKIVLGTVIKPGPTFTPRSLEVTPAAGAEVGNQTCDFIQLSIQLESINVEPKYFAASKIKLLRELRGVPEHFEGNWVNLDGWEHHLSYLKQS